MKPTMREIADLVAERHGLTFEDLKGRSHRFKVSQPRHEAMALIYAQGRFSETQIGRLFNRDPATVHYARRAYHARLQGQKPPRYGADTSSQGAGA